MKIPVLGLAETVGSVLVLPRHDACWGAALGSPGQLAHASAPGLEVAHRLKKRLDDQRIGMRFLSLVPDLSLACALRHLRGLAGVAAFAVAIRFV